MNRIQQLIGVKFGQTQTAAAALPVEGLTFSKEVVSQMFGVQPGQEDRFEKSVTAAAKKATDTLRSQLKPEKAQRALGDFAELMLKAMSQDGFKLQHPEMTQVPIAKIKKLSSFLEDNGYAQVLLGNPKKLSLALKRLYPLLALQTVKPQTNIRKDLGQA